MTSSCQMIDINVDLSSYMLTKLYHELKINIVPLHTIESSKALYAVGRNNLDDVRSLLKKKFDVVLTTEHDIVLHTEDHWHLRIHMTDSAIQLGFYYEKS